MGHPLLVALVDTTDARTTVQQVVAAVGVRPLDAIDQHYLFAMAFPPTPCTESVTAAVVSLAVTQKKRSP